MTRPCGNRSRRPFEAGAAGILIAVGLVAGACASDTDDRAPTLAGETATAVEATPNLDATTTAVEAGTTEADATTTDVAAAPTTQATRPDPTTTAAGTPPADPWTVTVLAIGDSFVAWSSWPELYAQAVESALGRPTELDTSLARGGAGPRLDAIRDDARAHERIRAADIVIVQPEPGFVATPMNDYLAGRCGGEANIDCFGTYADAYRAYISEYFDLIESLTSDETAIRAITTGTWGIDGFHPELRTADPTARDDLIGLVEDFMAVVEAEAKAREIPVIDVNTAFTGPDHRQLAPDDYLVDDRLHLAEAGSVVVAQLLTDAGFAPLEGA